MRISEVEPTEYIQIVASWEYLKRSKQYSCEEKHLSLTGEKLEAFKNRNGCGHRVTPQPRQTVGIVNFHSCFCDHLLPSMNHFLWMHQQFTDKGVLPYPGSLTDQPNRIMEVFKLIDQLKHELELENQKAQAQQKKK